ncbi:hypothetical protein RRG08_025813 [Elysia crispata]|uniref:Uncharacterized protein n=1 Tax=Elysia crispata TaxID=231223 RepID=A0AAE0Y2X6_9GAST|nr:hypothetical protein RRG08_025813 [Elysia crispata]
MIFLLTAVCMLTSSWALLEVELKCAASEGNDSFITARTLVAFVRPYLRTCWNVDTFVDCGYDLTINDDASVDLETKILYSNHETIRMAYYLFCVRNFMKVQEEFIKASRPVQCDHDQINQTCSPFIYHRALAKWEEARNNGQDTLAEYFACDALVWYIVCKQREYIKCYSPWESIMHLELLKLGVDCLERYQIVSMVTKDICEDQGSAPIYPRETRLALAAACAAVVCFTISSRRPA